MRSVLDRRLTTRTAALAGPVTHIPGLFYLIALNTVVAHHVALGEKSVALVTYNVVWFALPIATLVVSIVRPASAGALIGRVDQWARDHHRAILLSASFGAGATLVIRGLLAL